MMGGQTDGQTDIENRPQHQKQQHGLSSSLLTSVFPSWHDCPPVCPLAESPSRRPFLEATPNKSAYISVASSQPPVQSQLQRRLGNEIYQSTSPSSPNNFTLGYRGGKGEGKLATASRLQPRVFSLFSWTTNALSAIEATLCQVSEALGLNQSFC